MDRVAVWAVWRNSCFTLWSFCQWLNSLMVFSRTSNTESLFAFTTAYSSYLQIIENDWITIGMKRSVIIICLLQIRYASQISNKHVTCIPICNGIYLCYPLPTCNLSVLTFHAMRTVSVPGRSMLLSRRAWPPSCSPDFLPRPSACLPPHTIFWLPLAV